MNELENWLAEYPIVTSIVTYLFWIFLVLILVFWIRKLLRKKILDHSIKYKAQKGTSILGYLVIAFITVFYFTGNIKDLGVTVGLLTAGIVITLQEIILSIAGSFYILLVRVYKPGDRIQINGIKGDVIDVDSVYTTMMEIGEWISSDNYTGRIVKLSNAFVFKGPVYNYSKDFPFVWDEINLPIRYGSDIELAKSIVMTVAKENLSDYVSNSIKEWKVIVNKYYIEDAEVEPSLSISLNDNWIHFNLRFIVDYKKRRYIKTRPLQN